MLWPAKVLAWSLIHPNIAAQEPMAALKRASLQVMRRCSRLLALQLIVMPMMIPQALSHAKELII